MVTNPNMFDRPGLAASGAISGDMDAVWRGLLAPDTLSPDQRQLFYERILGPEKSRSLWGKALGTLTNPWVMLGGALTLLYPLGGARQMTRWITKLRQSETGMAGYNRYVTPIMRWLGSTEYNFAGTPFLDDITDAVSAVRNFGERHGSKIANAIETYERVNQTKFDRKTMARIALKLDNTSEEWKTVTKKPMELIQGLVLGGTPKAPDLIKPYSLGGTATQEGSEYWVYKKFREVLDNIWEDFIPKDWKTNDGFLKAVRSKLVQSGEFTQKEVRDLSPDAIVQHMRADYYPHMAYRDPAKVAEHIRAMMRSKTHKEYQADIEYAVWNQIGDTMLKRRHRMLPNVRELQDLVPELLTKQGVREYERRIGLMRQAIAKRTGLAPEYVTEAHPIIQGRLYSLRLVPSMTTYLHEAASQYAWNVAKAVPREARYGTAGALEKATQEAPTMGEAIKLELEKMDISGQKWRAQIARDTLVPIVLGRDTYGQMIQSLNWAATRDRLASYLNHPVMTGIFENTGKFGKQLQEHLTEAVTTGSLSSWKQISKATANYFFLTTLGVNPASAGWNLLQTVLTTAPMLGVQDTTAGAMALQKGAQKYLRLRFGEKGYDHASAFLKAFPAFRKAGLSDAPITQEILGDSLREAYHRGAMLDATSSTWDRIRHGAMFLFQTTERANRLTAFYGGLTKGLKEGLGPHEALDFASYATRISQFPGGAAAGPIGLLNMPAPLRQYMSFPLRFVEYLAGHGLRTGGEGGFYPGLLGRAMLGSGLAYEGAKQFLGTDLSQGLMFGALPDANPNTPFFPSPFVPPILSVPGGIASDIVKGEISQTPYSLAAMVPGGVSAARAISATPYGKVIGRGYADYDNPTPDGRYPLYTSQGALRGYFTPTQLFAHAIGLGKDAELQEQALTSYLMKQRDRLRNYRRGYIEALADNDPAEAQRIHADYQKRYPELGPIHIKKSDLRTVYLRQNVTRIERMLETLPAESRRLFGHVVGLSFVTSAPGMFGVDPYLLQRGTIKERDPYRAKMRGMPTMFPESVPPQQPPPPQPAGAATGGSPFTSFGGF